MAGPVPGAPRFRSGRPRGSSHPHPVLRHQTQGEEFVAAAGAWLTDTSQYNVLRIDVVSGSGTTSYLSAGMSIDALDLLA